VGEADSLDTWSCAGSSVAFVRSKQFLKWVIMKEEMLNIEVHDFQGSVVCSKKKWTS
jgi:hypothetical protein